MQRNRRFYFIGILAFLGTMFALTVFVWYRRSVNTPYINYVYPHKDTIEIQAQGEGKGEKYENCIPRDALHTDSRGNFVYVVEERQGILGNTYVAVRRRVDLVAADDDLAAVEGNLTAVDKVISYSDKELYEECPVLLEEY